MSDLVAAVRQPQETEKTTSVARVFYALCIQKSTRSESGRGVTQRSPRETRMRRPASEPASAPSRTGQPSAAADADPGDVPLALFSPRVRVGVGSVSNNQVMFSCVQCMTFPAERAPDGRMLCEDCREKSKAIEERRERKARIVGRQPLICEHCSEPFLASRLGHRYCSNTCRWRAWQVRQQADSRRAGYPLETHSA
jgi:hypothetical protein